MLAGGNPRGRRYVYPGVWLRNDPTSTLDRKFGLIPIQVKVGRRGPISSGRFEDKGNTIQLSDVSVDNP